MNFLTSQGEDIGNALDDLLSSTETAKPGFTEKWNEALTFLTENPLWLVVIACVLAAVTCIAMGLWKWHKKKVPDPLKALGAGAFFKVLSFGLILLLMLSDLFAMYNMFDSFRLRPEEANMFSFTFALFLEGFPLALGMIDPIKKDPAQFLVHRKVSYRVMSIIGWVFLCISWFLAIFIRVLYTQQPSMGGFAAFWNGVYNSLRNEHYNNSYLAQVFLFASPILTSVLAYILSYLAFGSSCLEQAARILRAADARHTAALDAYTESDQKRLDATNILWASLTGDAEIQPPVEFNDFRSQSMVFIHEMLINGCLDAYPALLKRYNHEVESALARYIAELSRYSSVPQLINQITVEQIVSDYDAHMIRDVDKWDYELCEPAMCADLEQLLNDAVIGAQFDAFSSK